MINPNLIVKENEIKKLINDNIMRKQIKLPINGIQLERKIIFIKEMLDVMFGKQDCLTLIEIKLYDYYEILLDELINNNIKKSDSP